MGIQATTTESSAYVAFTGLCIKLGLEESGTVSASDMIALVESFRNEYLDSEEFFSRRGEVRALDAAVAGGEPVVVSRSHPWAILRSCEEILALSRSAELAGSPVSWG